MQRGGFVNRTKCPKCGGNVYLDSDHFGWYEECLQCGYTRNLQKVVRVQAEGGDKYVGTPMEISEPKISPVFKNGRQVKSTIDTR